MDCLTYPFDGNLIIKKKRAIKKSLLSSREDFLVKRVAILGGSTTTEIKNVLELFLLNLGIAPEFYESEYAQYWQDAMFNTNLIVFHPDIVFIHTSCRNITTFPTVQDGKERINQLLEEQFQHFSVMWDKLLDTYHCPIIQNNFERPLYRLLGNKDISDIHGRTNFVTRLNQMFYNYAQSHEEFFIHDIDYLSADYGLERWCDPFFWHMYKYALCVPAIPSFAYSIANIIKSIYGKNKKSLVVDLDNTLWGGVIGDDGIEGIAIGPEVPMGQAYSEFQGYLKAHKDLGIILNVCSKNDEENALAGLNHPDGSLRPNDFITVKANWESKDHNITDIAHELHLGVDSLVFIDDNPAERAIVSAQVAGVATPDIGTIEQYIRRIDHSGFFEVTYFSRDDLKRDKIYKENIERAEAEKCFSCYEDYLKSLEMVATICDFEPIYMQRITQLTNKSNQFNLTTRRYSASELQEIACDNCYIRLCGRLEDRFGDNGVVSILIGRKEAKTLHIDLWVMSCRVLKRDMEYVMLDNLVARCHAEGIETIRGYYFPTAKNKMVQQFYSTMGFTKLDQNVHGNTQWSYCVATHSEKNHIIKVIK